MLAAFLQLFFMPTTDYKRDERIHLIDKCLQNEKVNWTIKKLHEKVNCYLLSNHNTSVSPRTIDTDIKYLIDKKGAPIKMTNNGRDRYYFYEEYFELNAPTISRDQFLSLTLAKAALKNLKGFPLIKDLEDTMSKIENYVDDELQDHYPYIIFDEQPQLKNVELIEDIFYCIKEKTVLELQYKHYRANTPETKIIHPYFLKQYNGRWFLFGWDEIQKRLDNSAIDRIICRKPVATPFKENRKYFPEEYFKNVIGVTVLSEATIERVVLEFTSVRAPYVLTKPMHQSQKLLEQKENGEVVIELSVIPNNELHSLILSYGCDVKVISPTTLVEKVKDIVTQMQKSYR
jgi:predicted DNA-binding transcriptional regulator YafY